MELISLLYGLYPRSSELRKLYGRWERGQVSSLEIAETIKEETTIFYDLAKEASLDYFTDPLFNWYDILRPIALSIEGIRLGPLTRYKETNTFYRQPIVEFLGKLGEIDEFRELKDNPPLPVFNRKDDDSYLYFLPGINSFERMSIVNGDPQEFRTRLRDLYIEIVNRLKIKRLLIYEPLEFESFEIYSQLNEITSVFLVVTGKPGGIDSGVRKKFFSIISDDPYSFSRFCEVPGMKIIDAQNTRTQENVLQKIKPLSNDLDKLIVANTESFDFLPRIIADKKLFNFKGGA